MQNVSYNIERGKQARRVTAANNRLSQERSARYTGYVVFAVILILLAVVIGLLIYNNKLRKRGYDALKKLNNMREAFFRNITHEFRTPLTVILGLSHDLQSGDVTTDDAHDMGIAIERQGNRMLRLINQLLDISKIRSAIGEPEWKNGNIVAYISMIVEMFEDYAQKRDIKLQFITHEKEIDTAFVPDYISKLMNNLLSNALKFTPVQGKINISMWRDRGLLNIDISDTGRGIPKESLPHFFEEFYQSDNIDEGTGTGVGLALVNQIVKQLDGTIDVESTEGKGTTFHIVLPLKTHFAKASSNPQKGMNLIALNPDTSSSLFSVAPPLDESGKIVGEISGEPSILIVEDNADVAAYIGKQLSGKYNVIYAPNGKSGLAISREQLPDAIVTDLMMPRMNGLELTRQIRADELTSHIPVIIVTAKANETDRIQGLEAGADAYLTKPFSSDELLTHVGKLLEQRALLRKKFSQMILSNNSESDRQAPSPAGTNQKETSFINRVNDCIYAILDSGKSADVNTVAEQLHMSYSQFYRKLTALTELTPVQYIQRIKVSKAKRMLAKYPEMSLNAIAEQCGFTDYSNFVRAFHNVLNIAPTQFIKQTKRS